MAAIAGPIAFGLMNTPQSRAQSPAPAATPAPAFEVATVKPNHVGGPFNFGFEPGGRFVAENVTLGFVLEHAYGVKDFQVSGGPAWIGSEHYNIEAKPEVPEERQAQRWLMVQSLLADRFKLAVHHETKELPVYALVVAKSGPRFHETAALPGPPGAPPPKHGMRMGRGDLTVNGYGLDRLADALSRLLSRVVLDQTGLKGTYDFTLKWTPSEGQGAMAETPRDAAPPPDASGPSIFTALRERLGLKLESQKGPVDTLVIDHVERPSEN
jgi:uncharacterized protein (TIGR03435 family)